MKVKKVMSYIVVSVVAFLLGFILRPSTEPTTTFRAAPDQEVGTIAVQSLPTDNRAHLVVKADYPNQNRIDFVLTEPVAPDFYVHYGVFGNEYSTFLDNPKRWDPLGVGIDKALNLIERVRNEVPGITEDIYAHGYELSITIADSHLSRKTEIIEEVIAIIQEVCGTSETV